MLLVTYTCTDCRAVKPACSFEPYTHTCRICNLVAVAPFVDPSRRSLIGDTYRSLHVRFIVDEAKRRHVGIW